MIDALRDQLTLMNEHFVEKQSGFKVKVIPYFCSVFIKKDIKKEGVLTFYTNQLLKVFLVILFLLFGLAIYDSELGINHGPIQLGLAILILMNLIISQIAIESLKCRIHFCQIKNANSKIEK
ncbi:hypothetical protein CJF42_01465 [Pseudoalteromonas sp. NBT06-2]|uniref:hypothetical protein n=1 Tax=Pseudoalteromonas sp. NBT06-2 TaxID=2025950 RepID=UPI000BA5BF19|nr:hypothetical protein [Pseudoalteromonas sp. NBT06-2]PAJ76174.1 hypothetical protein CJF42_01465 [Pseudoalteromonas sp. NBT06-2]